jgi:hypothetical protein
LYGKSNVNETNENLTVLEKHLALKQQFLKELHSSSIASHSSFHKTYDKIKHSFFWDGMQSYIQDFVAYCDDFQRNKGDKVKIPGTLQKLPIPT